MSSMSEKGSMGRGVYSVGDGFEVVYDEVVLKSGQRVGIKEVRRGNEILASVRTDFDLFPIRFQHDNFNPPFAEGKAALFGEGDYKTVFVDQDGTSDYVIKRYKNSLYKGENALELAKAAAEKLVTIHEVLQEVCGDYYLPFETKVAPHSDRYPDVMAVYEIQQRGILVSPWLALDPERAVKVVEEGEKAYTRFKEEAMPKLRKRGLIVPHPHYPNWDIDQLALHPNTWDLVTNRLVADDVVDTVFVGTNYPHAFIKDDQIVWFPRW